VALLESGSISSRRRLARGAKIAAYHSSTGPVTKASEEHLMPPPTNAFKRRLHERSQQVGLFTTLNSPAVVEVLAGCGFDWILIDGEHSPTDVADVMAQLQILEGRGVSALVRPAWSDMVLIKRLLDAGAQSLLIPYVETAEAAADAVSYTRYPPDGVRGVMGASRAAGYGQTTDYLQTAADELCVVVQIETAQALKNIEAIAAVRGVDAVFIGPADLAASLGHIGDAQHPAVQAAIDEAFLRLRAIGKPSGYFTLNEHEARARLAQGVDIVGVALDTTILRRGAVRLLSGLRTGGGGDGAG
jgi:4-hydroxy-2-oxoheptanedioate aldolase